MNKIIILSICLLLVANAAKTAKVDREATVLECVIFKLNDSASEEEALVKLSELTLIVQEFDGYVSRSLSINEAGEWMDLVYWTDLASAKSAAQKVMENPKALEAFAVIDESTIQMRHFELKKKI